MIEVTAIAEQASDAGRGGEWLRSSGAVIASRHKRRQRRSALYVPRQHGAWALIAIPLLVGVAAAAPRLVHLALAVAAVTGYMFVATLQSAAGSRSRAAYMPSLAVYGAFAAVSAATVVAVEPPAALAGVVVIPSLFVAVALGRLRRHRELVGSLVQAAQALVLAPVAALLGGVTDPYRLAAVAFVALVYVVGSVLVVRSVIRERGNRGFATVSITFHVAAALVAALVLPLAWFVLTAVLAIRSVALPAVERRRAAGGLPLKPEFVGLEELAMGILTVLIGFATRV